MKNRGGQSCPTWIQDHGRAVFPVVVLAAAFLGARPSGDGAVTQADHAEFRATSDRE